MSKTKWRLYDAKGELACSSYPSRAAAEYDACGPRFRPLESCRVQAVGGRKLKIRIPEE